MKPYLNSGHVLYGFSRERMIETPREYVVSPDARARLLSLLWFLADKASESEHRKSWRLTNDGSLVYAREKVSLTIRANVSFFSSPSPAALDEFGSFSIFVALPDYCEEGGVIHSKFHFSHGELKPLFEAFDASGVIHSLYDAYFLREATRSARLETAFDFVYETI